MIYEECLQRAIKYLRRIQNDDGGIPATVPGVVSGCWTSAETLECLLLTPYHEVDPKPFALSLINFLECTQIHTGNDEGGWPLVAGGLKASTMATGHAVAAFVIAINFFHGDPELCKQFKELSDKGYSWLQNHRNADGGWGVEPGGGTDGLMSRIISTTYAMRAYLADGKTVDTSPMVRDASEWISKTVNSDGGFGPFLGEVSDPGNTARALIAFIRSKRWRVGERQVKNTLEYIIKTRPGKKQLWPLDTEIYITEGAPGQTVYNSNTTADVLEAFLHAKAFNRHAEDLINWFLTHQNEEGFWFLGANEQRISRITTWSTNEAVLALGLAARVYSDRKLPQVQRDAHHLRWISIALSLAVILQALLLAKIPDRILSLWSQLSEQQREQISETIGNTFVLGILVNIAAAFIFEWLRRRPWK